LNAALGFIQEDRAERALASLGKIMPVYRSCRADSVGVGVIVGLISRNGRLAFFSIIDPA
jgi:hypothetical protein